MSYEWDNKKPTAQMLGRWQPFHEGHYTLFKEIIKKTGQVCIQIRDVQGVDDSNIIGSYGKLQPKSINNDSTTGHWELAGIISDEPFALYPKGFPIEIVNEVEKDKLKEWQTLL